MNKLRAKWRLLASKSETEPKERLPALVIDLISPSPAKDRRESIALENLDSEFPNLEIPEEVPAEAAPTAPNDKKKNGGRLRHHKSSDLQDELDLLPSPSASPEKPKPQGKPSRVLQDSPLKPAPVVRGRRLLIDDDSPVKATAPTAVAETASEASFVAPDEIDEEFVEDDFVEGEFEGKFDGAFDDDDYGAPPADASVFGPATGPNSPRSPAPATPGSPRSIPASLPVLDIEENQEEPAAETSVPRDDATNLNLPTLTNVRPASEEENVPAQDEQDGGEEDEEEDEDSTDTLNFEEPLVQAVSPACSPLRGNGVNPGSEEPVVDFRFVTPEKSILIDDIAQTWAEDEEDDELEAFAASIVKEDQELNQLEEKEEVKAKAEVRTEPALLALREDGGTPGKDKEEEESESESESEPESEPETESDDGGVDFEADVGDSQAEEDNDCDVSRHELLSPCARTDGPSIELGDADSEEEGRDDEYDLGDSFVVADDDDDYSDDGTGSSFFESPVKSKAKAKKSADPAKASAPKRRVLKSSSSSSSSTDESESESGSGSDSDDHASSSSDESESSGVAVVPAPILTNKARPRPDLSAIKKKQPAATQALMTPGSRSFTMAREKLALDLYREFNHTIFKGKLPEDLKIIWAKRLNTTAGLTPMKRIGNKHTAEIKLATKVVDSLPKLRNTLAHEMCHVATWILDRDRTAHGSNFQKWGRQCMVKYSDLNITVHHSYEIQYKYIYRCGSCGHEHGRHSKSINVQTHQCGCGGRLALLPKLRADGTPAQKSAYQQYVSDNFPRVKASMPDASNPQIMQELARRYAAQAVTSKAPPIPLTID